MDTGKKMNGKLLNILLPFCGQMSLLDVPGEETRMAMTNAQFQLRRKASSQQYQPLLLMIHFLVRQRSSPSTNGLQSNCQLHKLTS